MAEVSSRVKIGPFLHLGNVTYARFTATRHGLGGAPSSDRDVEDISKFETVLSKLVEAKGCIVHDDNFRSGKRFLLCDNKGDCKRKPRQRQRKQNSICKLLHPDAMEARVLLQVTQVVHV